MSQPPKGTRDLLPEIWAPYQRVLEAFEASLTEYNYNMVELPLFESTQVYARSLGEGTDISKEMYTFEDRNGDSFSLRPEGTAGLVRAYISAGLSQHKAAKWAYAGPMFRYERPQKGRYRQFYQLGVEALGYASASDDVEVLDLAHRFLSRLGLAGGLTLEINSLGDEPSRKSHLQALVDYFSGCKDQLSQESQTRLKINPLRILDSKQQEDQALLEKAPVIQDYFTPAAKEHFDQVLKGLTELGLPYTVNPRLVRGLDYYHHTVFEFTTRDLGSQNAVLSGGRYDGLVEVLGGKPTPAVGWAAGWDRLALLLGPEEARSLRCAVLPLDKGLELKALKVAQRLRRAGQSVEIISSGNMSKKLKRANSLGAQYALMFGTEEAQSDQILLKNLKSGEQKTLTLEEAAQEIAGE